MANHSYDSYGRLSGQPDQIWRFGLAPTAPLPSVSGVSVSSPSVEVGEPFIVTVMAAGGDGPLAYVYRGLPLPCISANMSRLSCTPGETGAFDVHVTVTDSAGNAAFGDVNLSSLIGPGRPSAFSASLAWAVFGAGVGVGSITVSALWAVVRWRRAMSLQPREPGAKP